MTKELYVFIHGLGANEVDWWGSTETNLRKDIKKREDLHADSDIIFYNYETNKVTNLWEKVKHKVGKGEVLADLEDIGGTLANTISIMQREKNFNKIKLFGHSMGGLVSAAAVNKIFSQKSHYENLQGVVKDVAFCGTPAGGSDVASLCKNIFLLGASKHTQSLKIDSRTHKDIMNNFERNCTFKNDGTLSPKLTFFKISNDEVVKKDEERFGPFLNLLGKEFQPIDIRGDHCSAVQSLSHKNESYISILAWINGKYEQDNETQEENITNSKVNVAIVENHKEKIKSLDDFETFSKGYTNDIDKLRALYNYHVSEPYVYDDGFIKRPYVDLHVSCKRTYLEKGNIIVDLSREIKVTDNKRDCEFEFSFDFDKNSEYYEDEYLKGLKEDLLTTYCSSDDRFNKPSIKVKLRLDCSDILCELKLERIDNYTEANKKGLTLYFNAGIHCIGRELEFLLSLTLPSSIWDKNCSDVDILSLPMKSLSKSYTVQEEIYKKNTPELSPSTVHGSVAAKVFRNLYYNVYEYKEDSFDAPDEIRIRWDRLK